jgi:3-phosphoshikimate 1-carboxyvinyltransferase
VSQFIIKPPSALSGATITLPLSKSIANRALIIAFLNNKEDVVSIPQSDDSLTMLRLLKQLRKNSTSSIHYNSGDAGTVFRFLAALFAITPGKRVLGGSPSLNNRPCGPLIKALTSLGAKCEFLKKVDYPPVMITGSNLQGGIVEVDASVSSQFISALMMVAPLMPDGLTIKMKGNPVSQPYLHLTAGVMQQGGINAEFNGDEIIINPGVYKIEHDIAEGDWSAASYWYALMALNNQNNGEIELILKGLKQDSFQGDRIILEIYEQLGVTSTWKNGDLILTNNGQHTDNFNYNLKDYPDVTPALAVTCAGLQVNATITGLETLAIKESNRLISIHTELNKLGYNCQIESNNTIRIKKGRTPIKSDNIETYNDHRIAMALSLLSLQTGNLIINDPMVVTKSYPSIWSDLQKTGFTIE